MDVGTDSTAEWFEFRVFLLPDELPLGLINSICPEQLVTFRLSLLVETGLPHEGRVKTLLSEAV